MSKNKQRRKTVSKSHKTILNELKKLNQEFQARTNKEKAAELLNFGITLTKLKKFKEACEKFKTASELTPNDADIYFYWGVALNELKQACEKFKIASELNPTDQKIYLHWGYALGMFEKYEEACEKFKIASELPSDNTKDQEKIYRYWGIALRKLEKYEEAYEKFKIASELPSDNAKDQAEIYCHWGIVLGKLEKYEEAYEKFKIAFELNTNDAAIYFQLGQTLGMLGKYEEACENFKTASELPSDNAKDRAIIYVEWGFYLAKREQYGDACEKFKKASELNPKDAHIYVTWGLTLRNLKQYEEAYKKLKIASVIEKGILKKYLTFSDLKRLMDCNDKIWNTRFFELYLHDAYPHITEPLEKLEQLKAIDNGRRRMQLVDILSSCQQLTSALRVDEEAFTKSDGVAHYSAPDTLHKVLEGHFKMTSISKMNDPTEGKRVLDLLALSAPSGSKYGCFVSCFTFNHAQLNQFRLYGNNEKKPTGVSVVFKPSFFNFELNDPNMSIASFFKAPKETRTLYRVLYVDPKLKNIVHVAGVDFAKRKEVRDLAKKKSDTDFVGLFKEHQEDEAGLFKQVSEVWETLNRNVKELKEALEKDYRNLGAEKEINELLATALLEVRFLVKDAAFKEEQECRIFDVLELQLKRPNPTDDYSTPHRLNPQDPNPQLAVKYLSNVKNHIKKIYLAPQFIAPEAYIEVMFHEYGIECSQPELPFRS